MITLKEIANICNVSTSTVSNILNGKPKVSEETKQRVLNVVKETGYQPNYFAQGMRKQKTKIVGIITEDLSEFSTAPIVESVMAYCEDHGYRTILINMRLYDKWQDTWYNDEKLLQSMVQPAIQELLSIKVDGIIYIAGHCRIIKCFTDELQIPGVVAYGVSASNKYPSIIIDDEAGGYDITKYLVEMGHENIGVIAGAVDNIHTQNRLAGYQKALFEGQVLYNPNLVFYGDWKRQSGYDCMKQLIKNNITAIFCMNDAMAMGIYDYCHEKNIKIGEEISIVGYDNREISEVVVPHLTTNDIKLKEIGLKAAEIMINQLDENESQETIIKIPCNLVVRDSVSKLSK